MLKAAPCVSAIEIKATGIVQGVGFRPFVYKLAISLNLNGWVMNTSAGVAIRVEGDKLDIDRFIKQLKCDPPPLASIDSLVILSAVNEGYRSFHIYESDNEDDTNISIPPDVGTCPDCLREYTDSGDRRFGYEFTNCVNCGPRFSITIAAPYDRKNTSMSVFNMCEKCISEYKDPNNRRFHAEPNACSVCGPEVTVISKDGQNFKSNFGMIRSLLKEGKILAIKGLGGYHLSCNALNPKAVKNLRDRKRRINKPFALMYRDLDIVRKYCELSVEEEKILASPARPILLLARKKSTTVLVNDIAPNLDTLGVMLPYTPLHYGLFDEDLVVLVMTSANISGDPQILSEEEAFSELSGIADNFVIHNRQIVNRADDSVVMSIKGNPYFVRRSRGYVPRKVRLPFKTRKVFAAGGDLKSVFAYAQSEKAVLSQYFGDLDNIKNIEAYGQGVRFFGKFLDIEPEIVVCDLHPNYESTRFAKRLAEEFSVPLSKVQHHKAHFASVMADNNVRDAALGVVADGTGYGEDETLWGFEFFYGNPSEIISKERGTGFENNENNGYKNLSDEIKRVGFLKPFMQPRSDDVIRNPVHMAAVLLYDLWRDEEKVLRALPEAGKLLPFVKAQSASENLSIKSSSCGRLFDAASALCGFTELSTYEGEPAMWMESLARRFYIQRSTGPFDYRIDEASDNKILQIDREFLLEMAEEKQRGVPPVELAYRFHLTVAYSTCDMIERLGAIYNTNLILISGGTFQNRLLLNIVVERLSARGMAPCVHRQVPTNDGGLALGQVMLAGVKTTRRKN